MRSTETQRIRTDRDGSIETGIDSYSDLVMTEQDRLSEDAYKQVLAGCNDDGVIIQKLIKLFLEPLSTDISQSYAGEEAGVGLKDIGNTIVEAWSALAVAKGCLEESDVTDAAESMLGIMNGGEERWKKHHG